MAIDTTKFVNSKLGMFNVIIKTVIIELGIYTVCFENNCADKKINFSTIARDN